MSTAPSDAKTRGVSLPHLSRFLMVFWAATFIAVGVLVLGGAGSSTVVELPAHPLRLESGAWDADAIAASCRVALERHGVAPEGLTQTEYGDDRIGANATDPDRALTSWVDGSGERYTVSLTLEGAVLRARVGAVK